MSKKSAKPPRSNVVAIVGLVLAVLAWPVGLVLSVIGLIRSGRLAGEGRVVSIVGLCLSVVIGAGSITLVTLLQDKAVDPGCVSAEAGVKAFRGSVATDQAAIQQDEAAQNQQLVDNDISGLINDMISDEKLVAKSTPQARTAVLRNATGTMDTNLLAVITGYQALQKGDTSQTQQASLAATAVMDDAAQIDGLCE